MAEAAPSVPTAQDEAGKSEHLNIRFKDDREQEIFFKLKPLTPLWKAVTAYCNQQGVPENNLRFYVDNHRIVKGDTPQSLEMEDGDLVDVHQEQQGGEGEGGERNPIAAAEDSAPQDDGRLTIAVKDQQEGEMEFRLKMTTALSMLFNVVVQCALTDFEVEKMMVAYCKAKEIQLETVRFLHDGERVNADDTPASRDMKDKDVVQTFLQQQGGDGSNSDAEKEPTEDKKHLEIRVKDQTENEVSFKIKRTTALGKVMDAYCQRSEKDRNAVRFLFEGVRIQETDTADKFDMEDGDVIEVFLEQIGGRIV